jgi:hypothetical protein
LDVCAIIQQRGAFGCGQGAQLSLAVRALARFQHPQLSG